MKTTKKLYTMHNGFHNTSARVLVEPRVGARVSARVMRRAGRDLCGMSDCCCGSSSASDPRDGEREGFSDDDLSHLRLVSVDGGDVCLIEDVRL